MSRMAMICIPFPGKHVRILSGAETIILRLAGRIWCALAKNSAPKALEASEMSDGSRAGATSQPGDDDARVPCETATVQARLVHSDLRAVEAKVPHI